MKKNYEILEKQKDVKLLLMYALRELSFPVTFRELNETLMATENVLYFDVTEALLFLCENGLVIKEQITSEDEEKYFLSQEGAETLKALELEIRASIRQKVSKVAFKMSAEIRRKSFVISKITSCGDGYMTHLLLRDGEICLTEISLYCPTHNQALHVKEQFEKDPTKIYQYIIEKLCT